MSLAGVLVSIVMLWAADAASTVRPSADGEIFVGGGYDSNAFLQTAASPDSPNYHPYSGGFLRGSPTLSGALAGEGFRLQLRYGADLRQTFGSGRLYAQDADLSLSVPELGPVGLRLTASVARFDASQFPSDQFWSWGAGAGARVRVADHLRVGLAYELDRRYFGEPSLILIQRDLTQLAQLRLSYLPFADLELGLGSEYLRLRSTLVDPTLPQAQISRWRLGPDASLSPIDTVTLQASVWIGVQSSAGADTDRQAGGAALLSLRISKAIDLIARYELLVDRAMGTGSSYSRQLVTVGCAGHLSATRQAPKSTSAPTSTSTSTSTSGAAGATQTDLAPQVSGTRVRFRLRSADASRVAVIGSWNDWSDRAPAQALQRTGEAELWEGWVDVGPGVHRYRFLVDGQPIRPVDAPQYRMDGFGGEDGVIEVPR